MNAIAERKNAEIETAPATSESVALMAVIERAARDPSVDIDKMERLLAMQERVVARAAKAAYANAFAAMQDELPEIPERGQGHGSIRYALWEDINDLIKPVLSRHGFALSFRTGRTEAGTLTVTAVLTHREGHSDETTMELPTDKSGSKNDVQAVGSSTSYGKRYTAQALLNLTSRGEDDDGHAAGAGPKVSEAQLKELLALAESVGADKVKFCQYAGVASFADIGADKFDAAKKTLEAKRRAK
jgi:hypothetical protein